MFARVFRARDALCINDTCVNEDQLKALLSGQSAAAGASGSGGAPETTGGLSANEIPDADQGTVADDDDSAAAVATSTLNVPAATTENLPADAPVGSGTGAPAVVDAAEGEPAEDASSTTLTDNELQTPANDNQPPDPPARNRNRIAIAIETATQHVSPSD